MNEKKKARPKSSLEVADPEVAGLIKEEDARLENGLELIPSENYVSKAVLEALGSTLTNKYSEGYPGKRYYGGNEVVDKLELLAIERAKKLFGAEHANVQPYSGSPANIAVYLGLAGLGSTIMGMSLDQGGHLTHGHKVSFSGQGFRFVQYGVRKDSELIDYEEVRRIALRERPKIIVCGTTAYPRQINFKRFYEISRECGALAMADIAHIAGLIAAGVHESPFPLFDVVTTTTHKTLRGPRGAIILCKKEYAEQIDKAVFPGLQGGPHNHQTAAIAVALGEALKPSFKKYAVQVVKNAKVLASTLSQEGFRLISGGTDNHLILMDVSSAGLGSTDLSGKEAETLLGTIGITVNKNMLPFDQRKPMDPSGIRLGTPAITTRGLKEADMEILGKFIASTLKNKNKTAELEKARQGVLALCKKYPLETVQ